MPIGSFIIVTEPLDPNALQALLPQRRTYTDDRHAAQLLPHSRSDHRLVFGGRARFALSSPRSDAKSGQVLRAAIAWRCSRSCAHVRIDYCWGGMVDMTQDRLPHAGETDGLFYSMGYSGHGTQMSVHMGECMARVLAGDVAANPVARQPLARDPRPLRPAVVPAGRSACTTR